MHITENYKNVHNGHGHGVSWEKPQDKPPPASTATQERQPRNAFQPATVEQRHLGAFTLVDRINSAARPKLKIDTVF
jgi:hypothetical protein